MIGELFVIGITLYVIFAPYVHAKAYEIREKARKMEIENDYNELELPYKGD